MKEQQRNRVWTSGTERRYAEQRIERAASWNRRSLSEFAGWLKETRCLSAGTVTVRVGSASTFVDAVAREAGLPCADAFSRLSHRGIEDFFVAYGKDHGPGARRSMQAAMRLFLRFAEYRGWTDRSLVAAVPSLRSYRLSGVARSISDEQITTLLESPWSFGRCPKRDRAIICLLAMYGPRRGQLSALRLSDVDWERRRIVFPAHKGGRSVHQVLTGAVAESLGDYLRTERPLSDDDHVFLRSRRPYVRLSPTAISAMVHARMVQHGISPSFPHAFRHAFATRLLCGHQSTKTIADLLGHRSLSAVSIYAKLDHARLLEVSVEWPEAAS